MRTPRVTYVEVYHDVTTILQILPRSVESMYYVQFPHPTSSYGDIDKQLLTSLQQAFKMKNGINFNFHFMGCCSIEICREIERHRVGSRETELDS